MKIYHKIEDLNHEVNEELVVTMGNFDGVHLGHQDLFKQISQRFQNYKTLAITFNPHPKFIINSQHTDFLLQSYQDKFHALELLGLDYVLVLPFTNDFRMLTPKDYVETYLLQISNMKAFCMGHDFSLGIENNGSKEVVKNELINNQIQCYECKAFFIDDISVSSSRIRKQLKNGNVHEVKQLMGRNYMVNGTVVEGKKIGRDLGFPTANLKLDIKILLPLEGVYKVSVKIENSIFSGVVNIGRNPTIDNDDKIKVECHILDFNQDIYGKEIIVEFIARIREEKKFKNASELIAQIKKDVEYCRGH